jgi:hypothetical protein
MGARTNRGNHLVWFRGCKDELHMGRWLFNDFEQCVETLRRNHVSFVEDENLVAVASRSKQCTFTKISGVVNTVVRSSVDFNDV